MSVQKLSLLDLLELIRHFALFAPVDLLEVLEHLVVLGHLELLEHLAVLEEHARLGFPQSRELLVMISIHPRLRCCLPRLLAYS